MPGCLTDPIIDEAVAELLSRGPVVEMIVNPQAFFSGVFTVHRRERGIKYDRRLNLNLELRL